MTIYYILYRYGYDGYTRPGDPWQITGHFHPTLVGAENEAKGYRKANNEVVISMGRVTLLSPPLPVK